MNLCLTRGEIAELTRAHTRRREGQFVVAILDAAAKTVDHILRETAKGGGTYGDGIRNLSVLPPNTQ